jgi:hypothetical protein
MLPPLVIEQRQTTSPWSWFSWIFFRIINIHVIVVAWPCVEMQSLQNLLHLLVGRTRFAILGDDEPDFFTIVAIHIATMMWPFIGMQLPLQPHTSPWIESSYSLHKSTPLPSHILMKAFNHLHFWIQLSFEQHTIMELLANPWILTPSLPQ